MNEDFSLHKDDVGTDLVLTVKQDGEALDISTATAKKFAFQPAGGASKVVDAEFYTDGTDGKLKYTTASGDLPSAGQYVGQVRLNFPDGIVRYSSQFTFPVYDNLGGL